MNSEADNVRVLHPDKDIELILYNFIDTLKSQLNKLKTNKLILNNLNKKKVELHQTQWEKLDKLLELQESVKQEQLKNVKLRDEIMYLDQCIHLKQKVVAEQDLDLLRQNERISNASSNYLNALDLKLRFKQKCVLNARTINFEVIVNTAEVCLAYDLVSERFELISLQPRHPKFDEIRNFLGQSGDISGLLSSVYLWTSKTKNVD